MKLSKSIMIGTAALLLPMSAFADGDKTSWDGQAAGERYSASGAETSDRALTDDEIRNIIAQSGADGSNPDIRYMGGPQTAIETIMCCENVDEQVETRTEIEETTEYIDAVTRRVITQPVQRTLIQPVTREVLQGSVEDITEDSPPPKENVRRKYKPLEDSNQTKDQSRTYEDGYVSPTESEIIAMFGPDEFSSLQSKRRYEIDDTKEQLREEWK